MPRMENRTKFSLTYILLAAWAILLIRNLVLSVYSVEQISYSDFLIALDKGEIVEIAVSSNIIQGKIKRATDQGEKEINFATVRVEPSLSEQLQKHNIQFKGTIENTFVRDLLSWTVPIIFFAAIWFLLLRRFAPQQQSLMLGKKAKVYMSEDLKTTFEDVAGLDEAKQELEEVIEFLKTPGKFTRLGGKLPKGILLVGPPGTGKTLLAKAVAGESKVPFFSMSGSEFVEMFVGLGAARVRDLFSQAKDKAPCIIFIDELDALGKARGMGMVGGHDEREQTLNQLLVEMDGFDATVGVILIAATNRPEILDPALLRPGRFDRQVLVDRPDRKGRIDILKVHMKNVQIEEGIDTEKIANMTPGFVGADLANLVNEATLLAVRRGKEKVGLTEFQEAVERIIAGLEKKNRLINPKEREIIAFHEIGHALVAQSLPGTDPVQKISIIPRGISALGYTLQVPTEDRFLLTKTELLNRIATTLGGQAAEELQFHDISTGAHNDLSKATNIARSMVKEYGMTNKLGQVYFESERRSPFLQTQMPGTREYSEETARLIDEEIKKIIQEQYEVAKNILRENFQALAGGAVILLEQETIDGEELNKLRLGSMVPRSDHEKEFRIQGSGVRIGEQKETG